MNNKNKLFIIITIVIIFLSFVIVNEFIPIIKEKDCKNRVFNKMKDKILLITICCLLLITGCISHSDNSKKNNEENNSNRINKTKEEDEKLASINITINNKSYILSLEDNKTTAEFIKLLPKEYKMIELNGNEKYVYLESSLPTNSSIPSLINKGDVMLFGDNCLVIFYKSFNTKYSYTKIGHIDNLPNLDNGNITIKFEK